MIRKYALLYVCVIIHAAVCVAQPDKKIDSLLAVLKYQKADTGKVNTLIALSKRSLRNNNVPDAKKYAADALLLAEKNGFRKGIADALNSTGYIHNTQGNACSVQGNYPEALKNFFSALSVFEKNQNKEGIAGSHENIGRLYYVQHNLKEALKNYFVSLELFNEMDNKNGIAGIYNNIGLVYEDQGHYPEALKYYYDAINMYDKAGNKEAMIDRYFNIGFLYEDQGNYPEALKNHLAALRLSEEIGTKDGIAASNSNIGGVYNSQGNYPEALKRYLLALNLYQETGNKEGAAVSYDNIGEVYLDLGNHSLAQQYLNDGLSLSNELGLVENSKIIYGLLTKLDSATGNWPAALNHYKLYIRYRDSLAGEEVTNKITRVQLQYDFDKKADSLKYRQTLTSEKLKQQTLLTQQQRQTLLVNEKELVLISNEKKLQQLQIEKDRADFAIQKVTQKAETDNKQGQLALLNKEKAIQNLELNKQKQLKNYLLAGLALFAILSFFIYRNYQTRQKLKLQTLRNKIASDLHDDVGSTLSSISIFSQMAQQQSKQANPLLENIEESSRKMLDAMADIVWSINPENDQFEKIILRMRSFAYELLGAKNIEFEFVADDYVTKMNVPMNVRKNLYLIFKEATNNIVKYAAANTALFSLKGEKNNLTMLIQDNGKGFDTSLATDGNGLKNMKKRATEMGAELAIDSLAGNGTTIQLQVEV